MTKFLKLTGLLLLFGPIIKVDAQPQFYVNQVALDSRAPKTALIGTDQPLSPKQQFWLADASTGKQVFAATFGHPQQIKEWLPGKYFAEADFSAFAGSGEFRLMTKIKGVNYQSDAFIIGKAALAEQTLAAVIHYYHRQRANTPVELAADRRLKLFGTDSTVDLHGGWCDASGDVSKYFSHLAYANYLSPQQIPLVTWAMVNADEALPHLLNKLQLKDSLENEALWGADYLTRSLSKQGYFYMIVFSYFNKDPDARRVVGLHANSVTTNEYQAAFREGGGMAIAALARISRWQKHGEYTQSQYLNAAELAFSHLLINNTHYDDDGKENIIDDYCALMAATELWISTGKQLYKTAARKRSANLSARLTARGYFRAGDGERPYWHAADAGLPIMALSRYLQQEDDAALRKTAITTIRRSLNYQLAVTANATNPFGYARQTFSLKGKIRHGYFIPHENETGWWWQGENARLASLAAAAVTGSKLAFPAKENNALAGFAANQLNWILGRNPYQVCFMYGFGKNNVPYMHSNFGHGSERGGISNGITGKDGRPDGSGIDYKTEAQGNEWRWTEQWLPHAAWFLTALAAQGDQ